MADIKEQSTRAKNFKVKTVTVALNPTAFQMTDDDGPVGGCYVSGVVEEVGSDCKTDVKKGDKVFCICHMQQLEHGTFADFAMVKDGHLAKIPDGKTFEGTASMGAGVTTVRQALYHDLKMPWRIEPAKKSFPILIYGASTASGTVAIQHAKFGPSEPKDVNVRWMLACTSLGEDFFDYGTTRPVVPERFQRGVKYWEINAMLLAKGEIKTHPITVSDGGLLLLPEG
ncbi:MAG: hypothetical protein ASARMPRED_001482 [Alectoria sarmentosa]|nr:MAG: hypothetical protein ASARMPRED_001482 [Alectoria sarmentosa]